VTGVASAWSSVRWIVWRAAGGTVGSRFGSCDIAVAVGRRVAWGGRVGVWFNHLRVSVADWRVVVVLVVWVGSFRNNAAADNGGRGLAVVVSVSCNSDSSSEEFLVATSEVLLEDGLLPSVRAVGVVGDPLGFELALVWEPDVTDLGAVGAGLSAVLVNSEIELGAV